MNGARHFLQIPHPVSTEIADPQTVCPLSLHSFMDASEDDDGPFLPDTFNVNGNKRMVCFLDRSGKECRIYDLLDEEDDEEDMQD